MMFGLFISLGIGELMMVSNPINPTNVSSTYFHNKTVIPRLLEWVCAEEAVGIFSKTGLPHPFRPQCPQKRVRSDDIAGF